MSEQLVDDDPGVEAEAECDAALEEYLVEWEADLREHIESQAGETSSGETA
jgi:hypothetical protein